MNFYPPKYPDLQDHPTQGTYILFVMLRLEILKEETSLNPQKERLTNDVRYQE